MLISLPIAEFIQIKFTNIQKEHAMKDRRAMPTPGWLWSQYTPAETAALNRP
jgi:hypothetical protein